MCSICKFGEFLPFTVKFPPSEGVLLQPLTGVGEKINVFSRPTKHV